MTAKVEKGNFIKSLFLGGVVGFMLLAGIFILSNKYFFRKVDNNPRLAGLEKSLQDIRAAMNIDSVRQFNIKKIMNIIEKYNPDLPSGMKYEIANEVFNTSVKYTNLEVDLICALITHESGGTWNPDIVSESGAMGLLQIMPTIGLWIAHFEGITWTSSEEILFDPIYNIRIGCRHLSSLIERYGLEGALAAFNGGEKRAAIWLAKDKADGILLTETSNYIPHVLLLKDQYKSSTL